MAIEKIITGDSQEELIKQAGRLVQVWESGRHIKSAASPLFKRAELEALAPPKGHFMTHAITMGSSDLYSANRNADCFPHKELLRKHATFVTHGANYHEHRNQKPEYACGQIKAAKYDEKLQRGEVVFWSEIEKAAKQFERARAGEEQHGSMACTVHSDVCDCCGFVSKVASDRCSHIRNTPGVYLPEFRKYAYMINVDPTFKDYSWVERPADRIAHTLTYMTPLQKAASQHRELRGDELAAIYAQGASPWLVALEKIAEFDQTRHDNPAKQAAAVNILPRAFSGEFDPELLEKMSQHAYPARVMRSMIKRSMVMPLASFNSWVRGVSLAQSLADPTVKEASEKLAGIRAIIIQRVSSEPEAAMPFGEAVQQFEPSDCCCEDVVDLFMDKARDQFSLRYEALAKRACANTLTLSSPTQLPASAEAFSLGALYNAYLCKVASLVEDDWMHHAQLAFLR